MSSTIEDQREEKSEERSLPRMVSSADVFKENGSRARRATDSKENDQIVKEDIGGAKSGGEKKELLGRGALGGEAPEFGPKQRSAPFPGREFIPQESLDTDVYSTKTNCYGKKPLSFLGNDPYASEPFAPSYSATRPDEAGGGLSSIFENDRREIFKTESATRSGLNPTSSSFVYPADRPEEFLFRSRAITSPWTPQKSDLGSLSRVDSLTVGENSPFSLSTSRDAAIPNIWGYSQQQPKPGSSLQPSFLLNSDQREDRYIGLKSVSELTGTVSTLLMPRPGGDASEAKLNGLSDMVYSLVSRIQALEVDKITKDNDIHQLKVALGKSQPYNHSHAYSYPSTYDAVDYSNSFLHPAHDISQNTSLYTDFSVAKLDSNGITTDSDSRGFNLLPAIPVEPSSKRESFSYLSEFDNGAFRENGGLSPNSKRRSYRTPDASSVHTRSFSAVPVSLAVTPPHQSNSSWLYRGPSAGPLQPTDPINFRALLEQDIVIDSDAFVARILSHSDQQCSLYLQQRIRRHKDENSIYVAVANKLLELSMNKFGNFLVSRCIEYCDDKQRKEYAKLFEPHVLTLSLDQYGCHVIQKLLASGDIETKNNIVQTLLKYPATLTHKNSSHIWSKILAGANSQEFYSHLCSAGEGNWADTAQDETGSLVVQSIVENWEDVASSSIVTECLEELLPISLSQYGNSVILTMIELNIRDSIAKALDTGVKLCGDILAYKIVDKCLNSPYTSNDQISAFITSLYTRKKGTRPPFLDIILVNNGYEIMSSFVSGNIVAKQDKIKLATAIRKHSGTLQQSKPGQKLYSLVSKMKL